MAHMEARAGTPLNHQGTVELHTERLLLRRCRPEDAAAMFQNYAGDPDVTRYLTWPAHESVEDTQAILSTWLTGYEDPLFYLWLMELKETKQPIGTISVVSRSDMRGSVEIGYCIGKAWWGRGLTAEALRQLISFFFERVGVLLVEARHDTRNPSSGRVMEKAGMRFLETTARSGRNNQGVCDTSRYALSWAEYFDPEQICTWALGSETERIYHDTQWGRAVREDALLFEMLVLEWMQAGLSWRTVLEKREAMRAAFDGFDPERIAEYGEEDIRRFLENPAIIRNRRKLAALPVNARGFRRIREEFGSFTSYLWGFTGGKVIEGNWLHADEIPSQTPLSQKISRDLKKRGFVFVGPIIIYSFLQAVGVVNDHLRRCRCRRS